MPELEAHGITKEQVIELSDQLQDTRTRSETLDLDPLEAISAKIDKLQESVDALASKLDR